jgi:soluble lytic murein transglycosylase-like protein
MRTDFANRAHSSQVKPQELFDPEVGERVASWYIGQIKRYLRHYGLEVSTTTVIWAYSAGVGRVVQGVMPEETRRYINQYNQMKGGV